MVTSHLNGAVTGSSLTTGRLLWTWLDVRPLPTPRVSRTPTPGTRPAATGINPVPIVLAEQDDVVHIFTPARELVTLTAATGTEVSRLNLLKDDKRTFKPGLVYAGGGLVFLERLFLGSKPSNPDPAYYFPNPGILAVGAVPTA